MPIQNQTKLTPQQVEFAQYVASGRYDSNGKKASMDSFARYLGVSRSTLYLWQDNVEGFWELVKDLTEANLTKYIPDVVFAMVKRAISGDVAAAKLVLNQAGLLRAVPRSDNSLESTAITIIHTDQSAEAMAIS